MKTNSHRAFFLLSTLLAGAIAASAQFALIDDFQADPGPLNGHNGWTSNGGLIVEDPEDPENTVANFTSGSGDRGSFLPAVIPNNTTATLFLKLRVATDNAVTSTPVLNWSVGMSDIAISGNGGFGDYQAQLNQNRDDGNTLPQQVRSRNAGNFDTLADLQAGVWYKFWMVIDNGANTYQVFMEGGQFPSQTLLQNPGGVSTFAFRNAGDRVNNDLIRLFVRLPGSHQGDLYLDEVWLDTAGENLTDPTESEDSPPRIVDLSPARGAMFHAPATGLSFRATSFNPNGIPTTGFNLVLNGEDVSSSLAVGGTAMDRTVSFAGLEADRLYSGSITVTDADERATTATVSFDTFTESAAVFIEAEDYNFAEGIGCDDNGNPIGDPATGGSFIDDPTPSAFVGSFRVNEADGYVDRVGGRGIDFFDTNTETGSAPNNAYRFCDPVGTQMTGDARRQKYIDASLAYSGTEDSIPDFHVHQIVAGEWLNYTRTFTEGVYHIYLRASSGAAQGVRLDKVTGNRSMPDQTTEAIGVFNVAAGAFGYSALTDQFGQPLPVVLSGVETLRLTALDAQNNLSLNFLILVSAGDVGELPPYIAQVSPGPDEQNVWPTRGIEVEIRNSGSQVDTGTIQVFLDDQNVTASATITGTAQGATVSYRPTNYQSGATHTVRVEFADNATPPQTHSGEWSFTMSEFSTGPVEAFAAGSVDGQWFGVCFSGPIDPATAGNPANYRINGTAPASAEVRDDGLSVRLQRSGGAISGSFDVVVENVLDWAGTAIPSATLSGQTHGLTGVVLRRTETDPTFEGGEWTCASDWIEITADGSDIWNEADAGRLVYETITGNFDKRVQVHSFSAVPDPWGKAIIDARASVDGWSRHVFVAAAPQPPGNNFTVVQERLADFGASQRWDAVGMDYLVGEPFPKWIRLQRVGNVFTAFGGSDGNNWTFLQAVERDMPETMVVGPALTSHQNGTPVTVRFSNYSDVTFENVTVTMVEHPQSQAVTAPATVVFEAQAEVVNAPPGELLYTWERSTDAGATWEVVQIGPDGTYSERVTTGGTRLYRAIASAGGAQATSDTATLEVEPAPGANIVWVSFHPGDETPSSTAAGAGFDEAPDVAYTRLIEESGHVVTRFVTVNDIQQSALDFLNTFDLVIISRSVDSGHYGAPNADGNPEGPRERSAWHGLTVPIINMAGYTLRGGALDNSTRLGFTTGNTMVDTVGTIHLAVNDPAHPVFTGIPLDGGNVMARPYADQVSFGETLQRGISVNAHDPVGGIVLATTPVTFGDPATTVDGMIIGEWQAGAILGQGEILAGHRLVFLSGSREATGLTSHEAGIFDLHPDGAQLFLNAVNYMTGHEIVVPPALPVVVHSPDDEEENVWQGTAVEVTLLDGAAPIVAASVTVWFNGEDVTASATITDTAEGVEVSYQPALVAGGTHSVRVEFSDDAGGEHSAEWSFTVATFDLPPEPFSGNIIIVTEQPQLEQPGTKNLADYLRLLGYTVETGAFHGQDGQLTAGEIEQLEAADLVLVHRSTTSGNYHEARTPQWNNLNVPLLLGSAYLARSTHWAWTPGAQTRSTLEGLEVVDSTHPIFAGLGSTLFARPIDIDHLNSPDAGNGELLATADGNLAVAAWEGAGFFQGTDGQQHVERRVFFPLMRYHETGDTAGSFADYSDNGLRLLANAVEYTMTGAVTWPPPIDGPVLGISIGAEGQIILDWTAPGFRLQSADTVTGPWADVAGGDEPPVEVTPTEAMQFYQLVQ